MNEFFELAPLLLFAVGSVVWAFLVCLLSLDW